MTSATALAVSTLTVALLVGGCGKSPQAGTGASATSAAAPVVIDGASANRGRALVESFQCSRCHAETGTLKASTEKDCVGCHRQILDGTFKAKPQSLAKWRPIVVGLGDTPSLEGVGRRFERAWLERFLTNPHDLRPALAPTMPRLPVSVDQARDIAAYFARRDATPELPDAGPLGDTGKGRELLTTRGCLACHRFSGGPVAEPAAIAAPVLPSATLLAPDLRHARDRLAPRTLVAWLVDPKRLKPDTLMPALGLTAGDARAIAGVLLHAPLGPLPEKKKFERLPVLERKVSFAEVDARVFHRTCWHCHAEPDYAIGDGGPGNSGGFGFKGRGLNLSDYAGIAAGFLDDKGERQSVFSPFTRGLPHLVESLVARHEEEAGARPADIRGMPLGLPALAAEEIQLVESWIAQGRPR